jgi:predicted MFS family arabinose efflux permease
VLAGFAVVELRTSSPLVDLRLLGRRAVLLTCAVAFVVGFGTFAVFVLVPELVQMPRATGYGLDASATLTGLYLVPLGIIGTMAAPLTGRLETLFGARAVMVLGTGCMVAAAAVLLDAAHHPWSIYVATGLAGVTVGIALTQAMNIVVATVPTERTASVSGLAFVVKSIGGTLGAQIGASVLAGATVATTGLPSWNGFATAFIVAALVSTSAVGLSFALPARTAPVVAPHTTTAADVATS